VQCSPNILHIDISMALFSRGLRAFAPKHEYMCSRCFQFSTTSAAQSGHNRWSKIKHDKGAVDAKKNVQRSEFSKSIAFASKSELSFNPIVIDVNKNVNSGRWRSKSEPGIGTSPGGSEERYLTGYNLYPGALAGGLHSYSWFPKSFCGSSNRTRSREIRVRSSS
jgi:hypothetical protein